ncbi:MAG: alanine racemase [Myxococcales bacterium]|nr:alanine racemase [Myxococcales bacterium]
MVRHRRRIGLAVGGCATALALWWAKPVDRAQSEAAQLSPVDRQYFASLAKLVQASPSGALPCAVIDLTRLDANLAKARAALSADQRLRIVVKSLPSIGLIRYLLVRSGSRELMVFHAPQVPLLLRELADLGSVDILLGKPAPAASAEQVLTQLPEAAQRVSWLIDDAQRLRAYREVARKSGLRLRISIELDVGLHRGGVRTEAELLELLDEIAASPSELTLSGFMGYDGHVPHAPGWNKRQAIQQALVAVQTRYRQFYDAAKAHAPQWFATAKDAPRLAFNSGGSKTLPLYAGLPTVVNDLAMGSGLVRPAHFSDEALADFVPALWLAVPVLKKQVAPPLPFLDGLWGLFRFWDPNLAVGFFLYGGTWDAPIVYPLGLRPGPYNDGPIRNLLPNQQLLTGSQHVLAEVGSVVLLHPREADNFAALSDLYAIRGEHIEARWQPLSPLN